jgi:nucleotide-binding universal stress UspA family protein
MKPGTVVVGVDFSVALTHAAPWLRRWLATKGEITLVHAVGTTTPPPFLRRVVSELDEAERQFREAQNRLGEWARAYGLDGARIVVRDAPPHELLMAVARERHAELTIVGAHRGDDRPWKRLGTTAERLLRAAETSLLIVRGAMGEGPRRILVAVDDVAITERLLSVAGSIADRFEADLRAVHVLSNAAMSHVMSMEAIESSNADERRARVDADLTGIETRWLRKLWQNTHGSEDIDAVVRYGSPGKEILDAAEDFDADLIVIGRYGIGRAIPAVFGSVVGTVAHDAACPVLVVNGDVTTV